MRGVLLAGGTGSRLRPLTDVTNKHLLPVGGYPMLEWPLRNLIFCGCTQIMVVTGTEHAGAVFQYLGSGREHDVKFTFRIQDAPNGIVGALALAEDFCYDDNVMVMLGDNIFENSLRSAADTFIHDKPGAMLVVVKSLTPSRFGVVEVKDDKVVNIVEKPYTPKSNLIQTGAYFYDSSVFTRIRELRPSARGELEVTDLNMHYQRDGQLSYVMAPGCGRWTDAGTFDTYRAAQNFVMEVD